jgi:hypothetical protein
MDTGASPAKSTDTGAGMDMTHCGGMGHCTGPAQDKAALPAGALRITFGAKSADWTPAKLAALPHKSVTVLNESVSQTYSGVPLMDLLIRLGVSNKPHGKDTAFYLVAVGADGFKSVFSLAEVNPDLHDATVIVADSLDGKALQAAGPLRLVDAGDKRPGRWARNLVGIRVIAAQ